MRHLARLIVIAFTVLRYGLDEVALSGFRQRWVRVLARLITVGRRLDAPRGVRLRIAMERLGPIFVKFGQVLSTRRDLLPPDVSDELAKLQDRVRRLEPEVAVDLPPMPPRITARGVSFVEFASRGRDAEALEAEAKREAARKTIPMGRLGVAEDCAGTFLYLASDQLSGYVTGQVIEVNGGQLMP